MLLNSSKIFKTPLDSAPPCKPKTKFVVFPLKSHLEIAPNTTSQFTALESPQKDRHKGGISAVSVTFWERCPSRKKFDIFDFTGANVAH